MSQPSKPSRAVSGRLIIIPLEMRALQSTPSQSDKVPCSYRSRTRMNNLPDDILIQIFASCTIETILMLRLTCASFCAVIQAYTNVIAPSSARTTFPDCDLLLTPPKHGYTLRWLRDLIPAQLASIALDKDKLRRHPYVNSGFLYGVPSDSECSEALCLRQRITNGWRVLRSFHLISAEVYSNYNNDRKRPTALRKASGGVRTSRIWQAVSCQYTGCTEHGMKHVFGSKIRRDSHDSQSKEQKDLKDPTSEVRRKETQVLRKRLAHLQDLSNQDLLDYTYLWRLLLHVFRPYSQPQMTVYDLTRGWPSHATIPRPSWSAIISDIAQGCSWLNWFVLHMGTAPFLLQWALPPDPSNCVTNNHIRNSIWRNWSTRSAHQIEIEREYISKFEFALRKRCLSSERLKRLEAEISRGRIINTISLDCIPWVYDQHHRIPRPPSDFPWYEPEKPVWLDGQCGIACSPGTSWSQQGVLKGNMCHRRNSIREGETDPIERDPLAQMPYLVYLGTEDAGRLWPGSEGNGPEIAF